MEDTLLRSKPLSSHLCFQSWNPRRPTRAMRHRQIALRACSCSPDAATTCGRRDALSLLLLLGAARAPQARAETAPLRTYSSSKEGYRLDIPASWEETSKAGADVLFVEPRSKGADVGITVSPIRIRSLEQFGDLATVGDRLLAAERSKESTERAAMLSTSARRGSAGTLLYTYDYRIDTTRGRKRIISTVAVARAKLYILNGTIKCAGGGGADCEPLAGEGALEAVQAAAQSFDV